MPSTGQRAKVGLLDSTGLGAATALAFAERRASFRKHVERARHWQQLIDSGQAENAADIAVRENLTRARVCQLLKWLRLAPELLAEIDDPQRTGPLPTEREMRAIASLPTHSAQLERFRQLLADDENAAPDEKDLPPSKHIRNRGFQHHFERARLYKAYLDSGQFASVKEIGLAVGLTGERVGQLLNLTDLAPDLQAQLDVPFERLPLGFGSVALRKLAAIRSHSEQRAHFTKVLKGLRDRRRSRRRRIRSEGESAESGKASDTSK